MVSWTALLIAAACVPLGVALRGRLLRTWQPPALWDATWFRLLILTLVVVAVGVPAMTGVVWLAPVYGVLLGLVGSVRRRCRRLTV